MGILHRVVRNVRRDEGEYVCCQCGGRLRVQYFECPNCGSYDVRQSKWYDGA